jgi:hypothetical protein
MYIGSYLALSAVQHPVRLAHKSCHHPVYSVIINSANFKHIFCVQYAVKVDNLAFMLDNCFIHMA